MVGKDDEFDDFVRGCSTRLLRSAWLLTADRHAAEDLLQEVLVRVYFKWDTIRGHPEPYARRALVRHAINRHRYRQRRPETFTPPGREPAVPDIADRVALQRSVLAGLRALPRRQRAAVVLRYFEDMSEADAALVLGCTRSTVRAHACRGVARLREMLDGPGTEPVRPASGARRPARPARTGELA
jgi:RNA polymerase sigma-70 factor (sigma-E family)